MKARAPGARSGTYARIYGVVRRIPRGRVATYGQIARLAGLPNHARQVGYALHALPDDSRVPWQRVVNHRGEVSARSFAGMERVQRALRLRGDGQARERDEATRAAGAGKSDHLDLRVTG